MRLLKMACWVLAATACGGPLAGQAPQCGAFSTVQLLPAPALAGQDLSLRLSGSWNTTSQPFIVGVSEQTGVLRVSVSASSFGPAAPTPFWEDIASVGQLPPGSFDVFLDVTDSTSPSSQITYTCGPTAVVVSPSTAAVPGQGGVGRVVLALLLTLVALRLLRGR